MPVWLLALQIALQAAPAIVQAIDVSKLPSDLTIEQMEVLQAAMDKAVDEYRNAVGTKVN